MLHDGTYANVESIEDVFSIGLNRAVTVDRREAGQGRAGSHGRRTQGTRPASDGGAITVRDGRYGPYVNWGKINATLPNGKEPQSVTVEEALELIAAKASKGGKGTRKAAPKKTTNEEGPRQEGSGEEARRQESGQQGGKGLELARKDSPDARRRPAARATRRPAISGRAARLFWPSSTRTPTSPASARSRAPSG